MVNEDDVKVAVLDYFRSHGYVHIIPEYTILGYDADFIATDEHVLIGIECKGSGGNFKEAIGQAFIYKRACDHVYIAIPNKGFNFTKIEENLCKEEGIGVIRCHFDKNDNCTRTDVIQKPSYSNVIDLQTRFEILNDLIFEKRGKARVPKLIKIHRICEIIWLVAKGNHNRQILIEKALETAKIDKPTTINMLIRMAQTLELIEEETKQSYILTAVGRYLAYLLQSWSSRVLEDLSNNPIFSDSVPIQSQILCIFRLKCFNFRVVREVYRVLTKQGALKRETALTKEEIMAASSYHRSTDIESIRLSANYLEEVGLVKSVLRPKKYYLNTQVLLF